MIDALQDALQRPLNLAAPFGHRAKHRQDLADRLVTLRTRGFSLFTSFKTGIGSAVDNLAIGPPGVFVIMTSPTSLRSLAQSRLNGLMKAARIEARLVGKQLAANVPVYPVICVPAADEGPPDAVVKLGDVHVATADALVRAMGQAPAALRQQQVLEIAAVVWARDRHR